ncbi:cytochrome P450 2J2-like [Branchiostoma floridae x Branchiostoma japonicum]
MAAPFFRWVLEIFQISELTLQTFLVFCAAFLLTCALLRRPRNLPPYPAGRVPVLGHLLALGRAPHLKLTAWRRQYGDVFTVRMGMEDVVVLNGYTAVKDALVDRSELFASRPPNYLFDTLSDFGKDIAAARWGPGFRQRKRFAMAALRNLGMKVGHGSIEEHIREEANCLRSRIAENDGRPFDIAHDVTVTVANVICSMVFGKRYDYGDETFRELSGAIDSVIVKIGAGQIMNVFPFLRFVPIVNIAGTDGLDEALKIRNVVRDEISRHREHLDRENPRDFIDFCLLEFERQEKVNDLTDENVLQMAQDLFYAGIDTATNTLLWSLLYMTINPEIQNMVHEELDAVVGESLPTLSHRSQLPYSNTCLMETMRMHTLLQFLSTQVQQELDAVVGASLPALSHRSQLPYVNACLMETMRVRTLVPVSLPHATTQDVNVQGYDIPKGTQVLPNLHSLHTDPAYWADPDRFDPDRFLDAEGNVINKPESFMPFGGGRRVCLGEQLAKMELFLFFSAMLQSFTFRTQEGAPPPNLEGIFGMNLRPHPFQICAIPR